jgi:hypothetical protein
LGFVQDDAAYLANQLQAHQATPSAMAGVIRFGDVPDPEVVIVPGGGGAPTIRPWATRWSATTRARPPTRRRWSGSVCTGALVLALVARLTDEPSARMVQLAIGYDPHPPFGGIDWNQVNRDIYEPMLGPMVQQQLADRPELLAKLSS